MDLRFNKELLNFIIEIAQKFENLQKLNEIMDLKWFKFHKSSFVIAGKTFKLNLRS